jgi:hypothetical protein
MKYNAMKQIALSNTDKVALVDDEDFERVKIFSYRLTGSGEGSVHTKSKIKNKNYSSGWQTISASLASIVMGRPGEMYDHKDRNPLNNRKSNLREATYQQNSFNRSKMINGESDFVGVGYNRAARRYRARIMFGGKRLFLGYFKLEIDAARAYNKKAIELFKEFANLNKDENGNIL